MNTIRKQTALLVRKDNQYVQTVSVITNSILWTPCAYDAMRIRNVEKALQTAQSVGGKLWLFNPVTGQLWPADMNKIISRRNAENDGGDLQQAEGNPQERSVEDEPVACAL